MYYHLPHIVTADADGDIQTWVTANRSWMDTTLDHCGAILLRGYRISTDSEFKALVNLFSANPLEYVYRSTPRTSLGAGVYTATEYPAGITIPQHNENAYQRAWPLRLLLFCACPAQGGGGETPLSSNLKVTSRIDPGIRKRFMEKQVMYIRTYRKDLDLAWQTVFQTNSKAEVESFCRSRHIACEWIGPDALRTKQVCQAFAKHPRTGAVVWFNQAHLFHPSGLDRQTRLAMLEMFKEDEFPRNVTYGDGSAIAEADLENIREAFKQEITIFQWRTGDVLIVDNMLVSHGRNPYKGKRRVLVGLFDQFSPDASFPSSAISETSLA